MDNNIDNEDILAGFTCERLSCNEINQELIKKVVSERGEPLIDYLQKAAWQEDENGSTAFYLIKNSQQEICLFFSLRCYSLFDSIYDNEDILSKIDTLSGLYETLKEKQANSNFNSSNLSIDEMISNLRNNKIFLNKQVEFYHDDQKIEKNSKVIHVSHTYPGLELVHFCIDDKARTEWKKKNSRYSLGEIFFWNFIVPVVLDVQRLVGCEYLVLFAADSTVDETLINYYKSVLKFECPSDIGTNKPVYDFRCKFMSQKLSDLKKHQKAFLAEISNPSEDAV